MGKSKEQKESESLAVENQQQTIAANKWMDRFSQEMAKLTKQRFDSEQAYLKENVDPALKGLARSGFMPGEEKRLRASEEERNARIFKQHSKTALGDMGRMGFSSNAPSGALARTKTALGQAGAESRVAGQRGISQYGSDNRRNAVGMQMTRVGLAPGATTMGGAFNRTQQANQAKFAKGGWAQFGSVMKGVGDWITPAQIPGLGG